MPHKPINSYLIVAIMLCIVACKNAPLATYNQIPIGQTWQFAQTGIEEWYPAKVPGTIHTDLFRNNLIPDPFYGCNEASLQWIGQTNWSYRTKFNLNHETLNQQHIQLVFEGLDTYADVYLNNTLLFAADNMFRKWIIDCKSILTEADNILEIRFNSAENQFLEDSAALGYPLPGGRWNFARKAPYHFGWDWGPTFITCGISKPIYLQTWSELYCEEMHLFTKHVDTTKAELSIHLNIYSEKAEKAQLKIKDTETNQMHLQTDLIISSGRNIFKSSFAVENPILWHTNGLGKPHLYNFQIELTTNTGIITTQTISHGIKILELVREDDSYGQSFYFKLNGQPLYIKGANYIPQHSFNTETNEEGYRNVIENARFSNMNMLRVWGGGTYPDDVFYDLCNRNGILVWQDFMFACAMYPGSEQFFENVRQEAIDQIKRLRNYSNIAIWCGNNEADEAWHNWGWQKQYKFSVQDSTAIWQNYLNIFDTILPQVVLQYDTQRSYIQTSPMYGWGRSKSMQMGDSHYWGIWWGMQPFEKYLEKVPRFMSEFGFQALPGLSTIRSFQPSESDTMLSSELLCHQKNKNGFKTIDAYLERENLKPHSLAGYIYTSQLIQAKGIGMGIEAQRRAKPYCMGTLYWQLNDCWPVVSWSSTDNFGNRKALQYAVKELYKDIMVSIIESNDTVDFYIVSDRTTPTTGTLEIKQINFSGDTKTVQTSTHKITANESYKAASIPVKHLIDNADPAEIMIEASFLTTKDECYINQKFLEQYGNLKLPETQISYEVEEVKGGYLICLKASEFTAHLQLYFPENHAIFDKNFIHIKKDEQQNIYCKTTLDIDEIKKQLRTYHLKMITN